MSNSSNKLNDEEKIELLREVCSEVHEQQKFAESKHGALIALITAIIGFVFANAEFFSISADTGKKISAPYWLISWIVISVLVLTIALIISFSSFLPKLFKVTYHKKNKIVTEYFSDKYDSLMNKIYTESGITDENEQENLNQRVTDNKSFIVKKISEEIKKEKINLNDENDKESKIAILAVEVIKKYINAEKNVLFFGEIKDLNEEEYLKLIDDISKVNLNKTYSRQIKINSVIAQSKYDKFKWAAWITIIGTVNLISALMVKVVLFG